MARTHREEKHATCIYISDALGGIKNSQKGCAIEPSCCHASLMSHVRPATLSPREDDQSINNWPSFRLLDHNLPFFVLTVFKCE